MLSGDEVMTHDNEPGSPQLEEQSYLVVGALADGERVDPAALKVALADPAARDYLVDLIALRHAVGAMSATAPAGGQRRHFLRTRAGWLTTAAAVVMSLTAGYFAGQRATAQTVSAPMIETAVDLGSTAVAPKPTHVVPLRPGVNWTEKAGGQ
jgi:hypothetical protein